MDDVSPAELRIIDRRMRLRRKRRQRRQRRRRVMRGVTYALVATLAFVGGYASRVLTDRSGLAETKRVEPSASPDTRGRSADIAPAPKRESSPAPAPAASTTRPAEPPKATEPAKATEPPKATESAKGGIL